MNSTRYADPVRFRQALTDRLRQLALDRGEAKLSDLQRQFAYDRLLARVFSAERDAWVLKGATALLARLGGSGRHTLDIDLYRPSATLGVAEDALRRAVSLDLADFFRFTLGPGRRITEAQSTLRVAVTAYVGVTPFSRFHIDLLAIDLMTGEPGDVAPLVPIDMPGVALVHYRAYPIADHVADKVCAMVQRHERFGAPAQGSTRYRDLADLAVIAHTQRLGAEGLRTALASKAGHHGVELPATLAVPDAPGWQAGYARVSKDVPALAERDLESALATAKRFVDPVLQGLATGMWRPDLQDWG